MTTGYYPMPLHRDGRPAVISDGFHTSADVARGVAKRQHRGVDFMYRRRGAADARAEHPYGSKWYEIPAHYEVPALATHAGRVVLAENSATGWWVILSIGGGVSLAYHHLQSVLVKPNAIVGAGTPLGVVGGSPTGYGLWHLHFDCVVGGALDLHRMRRYNRADGIFRDPAKCHLPGLRHLTLAEVAW